MLSPAINLGLLDPAEVIEAAEHAHRSGAAPLAGVEGFIRQILGWRDFVWHLYRYSATTRRSAPATTPARTPPGTGVSWPATSGSSPETTGWPSRGGS
jgi:deoxyribodipyrimidine photolyase-like uncharacterized protein